MWPTRRTLQYELTSVGRTDARKFGLAQAVGAAFSEDPRATLGSAARMACASFVPTRERERHGGRSLQDSVFYPGADPQSHNRSTYAAELSRSQPSSCAGSFSC